MRRKACPSTDCSAASAPQWSLTAGQLHRIPEASRALIDAHMPAVRYCSYCQAIYSMDPAVIFGWLDNNVAGAGWRPKLADS